MDAEIRVFHGIGGFGWGRRQFSRAFKLEAVWLVKRRGVLLVQASRDLDGGGNLLRRWIKGLALAPGRAFWGQGRLKPEQREIDRLRREGAKLKAARALQDSRGRLREGVAMRFGFVARRREIWPVRRLCAAPGGA